MSIWSHLDVMRKMGECKDADSALFLPPTFPCTPYDRIVKTAWSRDGTYLACFDASGTLYVHKYRSAGGSSSRSSSTPFQKLVSFGSLSLRNNNNSAGGRSGRGRDKSQSDVSCRQLLWSRQQHDEVLFVVQNQSVTLVRATMRSRKSRSSRKRSSSTMSELHLTLEVGPRRTYTSKTPVVAASVHPAGQALCVLTARDLEVLKCSNLTPLYSESVGSVPVTAVCWAPGGAGLVLGRGGDLLLRSWEADSRRLAAADEHKSVVAQNAHHGAVTHLAVSKVGDLLVSSGADGCVHLWTVRDLSLVDTVCQETASVHAVQFSSDGALLAVRVGQDTVRLVNLPYLRVAATIRTSSTMSLELTALLEDGRYLPRWVGMKTSTGSRGVLMVTDDNAWKRHGSRSIELPNVQVSSPEQEEPAAPRAANGAVSCSDIQFHPVHPKCIALATNHRLALLGLRYDRKHVTPSTVRVDMRHLIKQQSSSGGGGSGRHGGRGGGHFAPDMMSGGPYGRYAGPSLSSNAAPFVPAHYNKYFPQGGRRRH